MQLAVSYKCFAYKTLKKQIGQQCKIYQSLHKKGELGKLPGMYVPSAELDRDIPSDSTSAFFRGGIINTMACFEAYLHDLLDEAADTILYEREKCKGTCPKCKQLNYDHVVLRDQPQDDPWDNPSPDNQQQRNEIQTRREEMGKKAQELFNNNTKLKSPLRIIDNVYKNKFKIKSFTEELLSVGKLATQPHLDGDDEKHELKPMKYCYTITTGKHSKIEFKDDVILDVMLRFCYGIRCIMAHGNASQTLDTGVLKNFPIAELPCFSPCIHLDCDHSICKLRRIATLSNHFSACIEEQGRRRVLKTSRLFPDPKPLIKLDKADKENALEIVQNLFPDLYDELNPETTHPQFETLQELDENYALYHICRIYTYLKKNERSMYITYRLLVRINQFILVLAHRMRIAVGRILIYKYSLDRIWGVPRSTQGQIDKINKFEDSHKRMILALGQD